MAAQCSTAGPTGIAVHGCMVPGWCCLTYMTSRNSMASTAVFRTALSHWLYCAYFSSREWASNTRPCCMGFDTRWRNFSTKHWSLVFTATASCWCLQTTQWRGVHATHCCREGDTGRMSCTGIWNMTYAVSQNACVDAMQDARPLYESLRLSISCTVWRYTHKYLREHTCTCFGLM